MAFVRTGLQRESLAFLSISLLLLIWLLLVPLIWPPSRWPTLRASGLWLAASLWLAWYSAWYACRLGDGLWRCFLYSLFVFLPYGPYLVLLYLDCRAILRLRTTS